MSAKQSNWQDAEDLLIAAVEYLGALPDRERRFLAPGRGEGMSGWPDIVRSVREGDYGDGQGVAAAAEPRVRLRGKEMALLERVLMGPDALVLAVPEGQRKLLGVALAAKRWPGAGGFRWEAVREALYRAGWRDDRSGRVPAADAIRMRYDRAVARVAVAMGSGA